MDFSSLLNMLTVPAELIAEGTVPGLTPLNLLILAGVLFLASGYYLISQYLKRKKKIKELDDEIRWELEELPWLAEEEKPTTFLELPPPEVKPEDILVKPAVKPAKKKTAKKKAAAKKKTAKKPKAASAG